MDFFDKIKSKTRWNTIPGTEGSFRLSCSDESCSLSCANLRNGKLSTTSMHGNERHSYTLSKNDMAFATLMFLRELSTDELIRFCNMFNNSNTTNILTVKDFS